MEDSQSTEGGYKIHYSRAANLFPANDLAKPKN